MGRSMRGSSTTRVFPSRGGTRLAWRGNTAANSASRIIVRLQAVAGVQQCHAARQAGLARPTQLLKRDLWLGFEADLLGHTRLAPTGAILRPVFRQIS